jgi:hypothetical protein
MRTYVYRILSHFSGPTQDFITCLIDLIDVCKSLCMFLKALICFSIYQRLYNGSSDAAPWSCTEAGCSKLILFESDESDLHVFG